jgi:hypothetical protein
MQACYYQEIKNCSRFIISALIIDFIVRLIIRLVYFPSLCRLRYDIQIVGKAWPTADTKPMLTELGWHGDHSIVATPTKGWRLQSRPCQGCISRNCVDSPATDQTSSGVLPWNPWVFIRDSL